MDTKRHLTKLRAVSLLAGLLAVVGVLTGCEDIGDAGQGAVQQARSQIGTSYRYGEESPERGFDCSGLIYWSYQQVGMETPRTSSSLRSGTNRISRSELQAGDLVFYGYDGQVSHVAMYTGDGTLVHAPSSGDYVREESIDTYWTDNLIGYGRLP